MDRNHILAGGLINAALFLVMLMMGALNWHNNDAFVCAMASAGIAVLAYELAGYDKIIMAMVLAITSQVAAVVGFAVLVLRMI